MSGFGVLEDAGGFLFGLGILVLISIWSLFYATPMLHFLALFLIVKGAKNIHILEFLISDFGGYLRFMTVIWHLNLDFDLVPSL